MRFFFTWFLWGLFLLLAWTPLAHAYLDPGSGSMMLQMLLGGVAGTAVILRLYWKRLLAFLGISKKEETSAGERVFGAEDGNSLK